MRKRFILALIAMLLSVSMVTTIARAEESKVKGLQWDEVSLDPSDRDSIKRGAAFFASNCLSCHSLIYLRYDNIAQAAGMTYEKMPIQVKNWPNGITPPDLSLEASVRGPDWIYTYLHSFYQDNTRPMGVNNLLVPNTSMPGIIVPYQGEQELVKNPHYDWMHHVYWYDALKMTKPGSMSPDTFDATITDLVNFLVYAAEPYRAEQHKIGWWVLGFLVIFFMLVLLLKREYWKDVSKYRKD